MARIADGVEQRHVDVVASFGKFGDRSKRSGLRFNQVIGVDFIGPLLESGRSLCACRHDVHQPFRNLDRTGIAWMIARSREKPAHRAGDAARSGAFAFASIACVNLT